MRQRTQFGQERQQARIRALDPNLFAHADFVAAHMEDLFGLVVGGEAWSKAEALAEGEAGKRRGGGVAGGGGGVGDGCKGTEMQDESCVVEGEVDGEFRGKRRGEWLDRWMVQGSALGIEWILGKC